ncbi:unnamed protein product [Chrysodeixis includens]|uniref:Uncharacterized protein n=1 Tax=Chrysodeixis includens TaxID=689277 RepID=A0A9P0BNN2_CHRIL|nr:unnamed protein product [Chrysodeixis includens]
MIKLIILVSVVCTVHGQIFPLIYAAPSAVSHQSRIDVKHSPGFISSPLIYSPAATLYESQKSIESPRQTVITPVFTSDTILTPVALSFFHNLPLARALEHPISIDKVQNESAQDDDSMAQRMAVIKENSQEMYGATVKEASNQQNQNTEDKQRVRDNNYVIVAYDDINQVTTDVPKMDVV